MVIRIQNQVIKEFMLLLFLSGDAGADLNTACRAKSASHVDYGEEAVAVICMSPIWVHQSNAS